MGFSDLGKKLSKLGQDTKNGVQKVSDSVSISNRISAEKKSLERLFAAIGETVYKVSPDVPKEGLEDEWAAVKVAYANIASLGEQLDHVKGIIYCPNCGRPADKGDKFCAKCGFRLDNLQETLGGKMAQDIKEAGREVGKLAEGAADKTGELVGGAAADTRNFFARLKDNASRFAKNAGEKMKSKVTSEDVEMDDFGRHAMEEAQEAAAQSAAQAAQELAAAQSMGQELTEDVQSMAQESAEALESAASEPEEAAENTAQEIVEAAEDTAKEIAEEEEFAAQEMKEAQSTPEEAAYDEFRAVDDVLSGPEEDASADASVPAEPAAPADAEDIL